MRVAIFKRPPRVIPSLSYGRSKFGSKLGHFLPRFYTNPSLFLAFTVFTSSVYFFWSFPFKPPPPLKIRPGGTPAVEQLRGGYYMSHNSCWGWGHFETTLKWIALSLTSATHWELLNFFWRQMRRWSVSWQPGTQWCPSPRAWPAGAGGCGEAGRGRGAPGWLGTLACGSCPCSAPRRRRTARRSAGRSTPASRHNWHPEKLRDLKSFKETQFG